MPSIRETDLYEPVAEYLRSLGYEVRGEVRSIDLVAKHEKEIIAVELKLTMGLELILQAVQRQKSTDNVYVAVPARAEGPPLRNFRRVSALLKQLEIGLILVHFRPSGTKVEVRFHPAPWKRRKSKKERKLIIQEFDGRTGDRNQGGSAAGRMITAYRENAIHIACALSKVGPTDPASLRSLGTGTKTGQILFRNVYGWFDHPEKGVYTLHASGEQALREYPDLAAYYSRTIDEKIEAHADIPPYPKKDAPRRGRPHKS